MAEPVIFSQAQKDICNDRHRFRVVCCGRRFGKTTLAVFEMIAFAMRKPGNRVAYIAPNYQQARDIAWDMLKSICDPIILKANESRLELTIKSKTGEPSTIILRGWEAVESLRGQKFAFVVIDEIASMRNWESGWQEVIRPTLTDVQGEALFISTPKGFNHFFELFEKEKVDKDYKSFRFTSYDNPHLAVEEIDKAREELTENAFSQEYMADFRKMTGLVYPQFERNTHILVDDAALQMTLDSARWYVSADFGFTNPTSVHLYALDFDDNLYAMDEIYQPGLTTDKLSVLIKQMIAGKTVTAMIGDSAAAQTIADLKTYGLFFKPIQKAAGSNGENFIRNGISEVARRLQVQEGTGKPKLFVHPKCRNLVWEFETYQWPEKRDMANESEVPVKENDHAMDDIRYICTEVKRSRVGKPYKPPQMLAAKQRM